MAVTRISGFASGLDIDSVVKQLMQAEKKPLDKLNQSRQLLEWKRENYREVSTKVIAFAQNKISDIFSKASSLNAQKAGVSGNTTAVTVNASSSASGVLDISVTELAMAASIKSTTAPAKTDPTNNKETDWGKIKLSDIDKSGIGTSDPTKMKTTVTIGKASIQIDNATETLSSFVNKINSNSDSPVTAVYDSSTGKISLTSKMTGETGNDITVEGSVFTALGLDTSLKLSNGKDATVNVNGLDIHQSSNSFSLNGFDITLNAKSNGESTHVEVTKDVDKIVENVQNFVDSYNELLSYLNGKVNEEKYSKYAPLTSDQKKEMSENEIELWEEKAKSGMLKRDSILSSAISSMRTAMIESIEGITLSDGKPLDFTRLGITTGTYDTNGKLILDQDKLKKAIEKDSDIVNDFFGTNYSTSFLNNDYAKSDGILARLRKISNNTLAQLASTAGTSKVSADITSAFNTDSSMGRELYSLDRRISEMESKLVMKENNYYKKFTAMETAINKYNSIQSSLSSFLS